jgi:hypothetical protein
LISKRPSNKHSSTLDTLSQSPAEHHSLQAITTNNL